jgi:hypothetical protein
MYVRWEMAESRERILELLALGESIANANRVAREANFGPSTRGDRDNEYIATAKLVEELFLSRGWFAPLPKPDFSNTSDDSWHPACNGTETPFIARSGAKLLYCFQPSTGNHAYIDVAKDMVLTDEEALQHLQTY